ncbi:MAG: sulfotransferase domain-containing protein [bacterium]|nr:sulfotransferase domain-containing protein [bacterium]
MKKSIKQVLRPLTRLPLLGRGLRQWKINRNYPIERTVVKGTHRNDSTCPSIVFFTVYKAASSFIGGFMKKVVAGAGMSPVDLDGYFFNLGKGRQWEGGGRQEIHVDYSPTGYFYGPFRSFNKGIPRLENYKVILVLRDPRDVVVSAYYSMISHVTPLLESDKAVQTRMERRKKNLADTVDQYVLKKLEGEMSYLRRYYEYHRELKDKPNVLLLKYEDMVSDFDSWLERLLDFTGMDVAPGLIEEIKAGAGFNVKTEDVSKHKRQVTPGDHRRKLKPETIKVLNAETAKILELFDYPV